MRWSWWQASSPRICLWCQQGTETESPKKREKQSSGVWQDGGTFGPGWSENGLAVGAVSSGKFLHAGNLYFSNSYTCKYVKCII